MPDRRRNSREPPTIWPGARDLRTDVLLRRGFGLRLARTGRCDRWRVGGDRLDLAAEGELLAVVGGLGVDDDDLAGLELAVEDLLGQDVLDVALDRPAQRSGAQHRVVTLLREQPLGVVRHLDRHVAVL